jgi:AcrR family transcriptional regulator
LTGPEVTNASYPGSSVHRGGQLGDRMIDAALDCVAEVLWQDAGHRAPMQVTADGVEKLHGRALRIVEADKAALAPDRQHAGKVCVGAVRSELVKGPRKFGEAGALGDDQPPNTDSIRSHRDLHIALRDVSERMADVGVNDLGVAERGQDALGAFLHDRGEQAVLAAEKRIYGGLGRPGALDDKVDGGAAVAVLQKDFDGGVQNLRASPATDPIGPLAHHARTELATAHHFAAPPSPRPVRSSSVEAADNLYANPRLYGALRRAPPENAARILLETERLLRIYGHRKITVADIADACGFSAANVYRYFSSRRAILDALASHYLHETERAALDCAIRNSDSARDRLSGFLSGLNTALIIFADREPRVSELLADTTAEQWPCYTHHDARLIRHITRILAAASASGEFRLVGDAGQEARRVKAAACALVEPDVILSCRDRYDAATREAVSRLIAAALSNQSVSPSRASRHTD